MTPEIQARIAEKARRQKRRGKKAKRAKMYQRANSLAKNAWAQGNVQMLSAPVESDYAQVSMQSRNQMKSVQSVYMRSANVRSYADDDDAEEEAMELALDQMEIAQ